MSHLLSASDLAVACHRLGLTTQQKLLEKAAQAAAEAIAEKLNISIASDASTEDGFGGLCVGFAPSHDGQACPDDIADLDEGSDWAMERNVGGIQFGSADIAEDAQELLMKAGAS